MEVAAESNLSWAFVLFSCFLALLVGAAFAAVARRPSPATFWLASGFALVAILVVFSYRSVATGSFAALHALSTSAPRCGRLGVGILFALGVMIAFAVRRGVVSKGSGETAPSTPSASSTAAVTPKPPAPRPRLPLVALAAAATIALLLMLSYSTVRRQEIVEWQEAAMSRRVSDRAEAAVRARTGVSERAGSATPARIQGESGPGTAAPGTFARDAGAKQPSTARRVWDDDDGFAWVRHGSHGRSSERPSWLEHGLTCTREVHAENSDPYVVAYSPLATTEGEAISIAQKEGLDLIARESVDEFSSRLPQVSRKAIEDAAIELIALRYGLRVRTYVESAVKDGNRVYRAAVKISAYESLKPWLEGQLTTRFYGGGESLLAGLIFFTLAFAMFLVVVIVRANRAGSWQLPLQGVAAGLLIALFVVVSYAVRQFV